MKRHPFEPFSLVFGLVFAAVGATFLFDEPDISKLTAASVWPFVAIFLGLLVLAAAVRRGGAKVPEEPFAEEQAEADSDSDADSEVKGVPPA